MLVLDGGMFCQQAKQQSYIVYAGVAKLADALALGASGVILGGSSPLPGTS